ncbi:MAG: reprolysin-like metallopeptidase [Saprospiraceae bacterium]
MFSSNHAPLSFALIFSICFPAATVAQPVVWADIPEAAIASNPNDRQIVPDRYRTLRLDFAQLRTYLLTAPAEADYLQGQPGLSVDFPLPGGGTANFEVWDAPVLHPDLGKAFPEIRSFAGKSRSNPGMTARFDISPKGLCAMLFNPGGSTVFIDPYARGNNTDYICYFRKNFVQRAGDRLICHVNDGPEKIELPPPPPPYPVSDRAGDCGNRRQYRLALACTGEYANYHGSFGTDKAPALAAMNTSMTRVNGVFERDCGLTMIIVPNDTAIIYTNASTDPYTNSDGNAMLGQNQTTCNAVIGSANYDIGHVFSTGGGGIASLNSPCNNSFKAQGVTGSPNPVGDPFDIDYVAHEMGHQWGAQHTQYNNCNRSNSSAMEPGSASTIMGYAGICDPNVQSNSDDYFHARSLQQIGGFVTGAGNSCAVLAPTGNSAPVVPALVNRNIPKSTPFILTGSATDPNGDPMTFCWEQTNAYSSPAQTMPPASTNTTGPVFRSLQPVGDGSRYFPEYAAVLTNTTPTWEVLPSVGRTMSFRLTVRDNNANAGCTTEQNMTVTTSSSAGPFAVTVPNGGESYPSGSIQTVTWNVSGSSSAPINCANVDILISTDGGGTYATLFANAVNDGSQQVTYNVPPTPSARIALLAVGNVFYDISNNNFTISQPLPVEITSFDARREGDAVRLNWATATETDNRGFRVERSTGTADRFEQIGWVDGNGTTTLLHSYSFFDNNLHASAAVLYYRLRQTDHDGQEHLSDIRAVYLGGNEGELLVWPNPARDKIRVQLPDSMARETPQLTVLNPAGVPVLELAALPDSGEVDVQNLLPGLYTVQVSVGNQAFSGRFVRSADY